MQQFRRKLVAATLGAVALMAGAVPVLAQGPGRGVGNRLDYLAGYLSLTDAQKTQAQTIFDAAKTASSALQGQLTGAQDALRAGIKANSADSELDRLAGAVGTIQGQLAGIQAKASAKFYALLTPEQKTKYDAMGNRGGGGGPGRPRP
jgi:Spy/CpxP family protein refolding chaperone